MGRAGPEKTSQGICFGAVLCKLGRAPPTASFLQPLPEWLCFCFQEELCWGTKWFCISPLAYTALRQGWSISIMHVVRPANHPVSQQQTKGWLHSQGPSIISLSASTQLVLLAARDGASGAGSPLVCSLPWVGQLPLLSETFLREWTTLPLKYYTEWQVPLAVVSLNGAFLVSKLWGGVLALHIPVASHSLPASEGSLSPHFWKFS